MSSQHLKRMVQFTANRGVSYVVSTHSHLHIYIWDVLTQLCGVCGGWTWGNTPGALVSLYLEIGQVILDEYYRKNADGPEEPLSRAGLAAEQ